MISYDIDGVLTAGVKPAGGDYIVLSGRLAKFMPETIIQMEKLGITGPIYLRPTGAPADRVLAGIWKATMINFAKVSEHWEDDPIQGDIINKMCRIKLVMVGQGYRGEML